MAQRWKPSVTVAAVAGREQGGRTEYLLVEEHTPTGLRLNNPAGHLEPGETPQQAVVREALEESGRAFVPETFVGVYLAAGSDAAGPATYLRLAFAGHVGDADPARRLDHGIVGTVWMTLEELRASRPRLRSPLVLRCIEDAAAGRVFPLDAVSTDASALAAPASR